MDTDSHDVAALGEVIVRRREAMGLKTYRLAQRAGVADPFLRRIEEGKPTRPKTVGMRTVARLARALGTTTDALLIEAGLMDAPQGWSEGRAALDVYLRETSQLRDDDISAVTHLVRRLAETAEPYAVDPPDLEPKDEEERALGDEKDRQLRQTRDSIDRFRQRTEDNPDARNGLDKAAYDEEIPPAPDDHGPA